MLLTRMEAELGNWKNRERGKGILGGEGKIEGEKE